MPLVLRYIGPYFLKPYAYNKALRRERLVFLKLYLIVSPVTTCGELIAINSYCLGRLRLLIAIDVIFYELLDVLI